MRHPGLLILDEATNAVDWQLEAAIRTNLATVMKGRTMVIITHRLDTVLNVDHVVYLHDGSVVKEGNATEVLSQRGAPDGRHERQDRVTG